MLGKSINGIRVVGVAELLFSKNNNNILDLIDVEERKYINDFLKENNAYYYAEKGSNFSINKAVFTAKKIGKKVVLVDYSR